MNKFLSRKLVAFLIVVALIVLNHFLKWNMTTQEIYGLVATGASYIFGQGYVDAKGATNTSADDVAQAVIAMIDKIFGIPISPPNPVTTAPEQQPKLPDSQIANEPVDAS